MFVHTATHTAAGALRSTTKRVLPIFRPLSYPVRPKVTASMLSTITPRIPHSTFHYSPLVVATKLMNGSYIDNLHKKDNTLEKYFLNQPSPE